MKETYCGRRPHLLAGPFSCSHTILSVSSSSHCHLLSYHCQRERERKAAGHVIVEEWKEGTRERKRGVAVIMPCCCCKIISNEEKKTKKRKMLQEKATLASLLP